MSTATATILQPTRLQRLLRALSIPSSRTSTHSGPGGVDDDGIICIGGLLISTHVHVDRDLRRAYDLEISTRFNQELRQRVPGKTYWPELRVAGTHKARLKASVVVKTLEVGTKRQIYSHVTRMDWIKPALQRLSLELYVIVSMPLQPLAGNSEAAEMLVTTAWVQHPLGANSLCGARIIVPTRRRNGQTRRLIPQTSDLLPPLLQPTEQVTENVEDHLCHQCRTRMRHGVLKCSECHHEACEQCWAVHNPNDGLTDLCVVGGTWLFGESFCVQTALHPFSHQIFGTAWAVETPTISVHDDGPLSLFAPADLDDPLAGSSEVSRLSCDSVDSSSHEAPEVLNEANSGSPARSIVSRSPWVSLKLDILQKGTKCDWLTFSFNREPVNSADELLYRNIIESVPITEIYLEEPEKSLPVSICLSTGTVAGELLPGEVHYNLPQGSFQLRAVSLNLPLTRGCSGAWVVHGSKLCGIVLLGMTSAPLIYIMLASSIKKEMEEISGLSVRLPCKDDFDRHHLAMRRTGVKSHVELQGNRSAAKESAASRSRTADLDAWLSQSEISSQRYATHSPSKDRPRKTRISRLLEIIRTPSRSSISSGGQSVSSFTPSLVSDVPFSNTESLSTRASSVAASSLPRVKKAIDHPLPLQPISESGGPIPGLIECVFIVVFDGLSHIVDRELINWNDRSWCRRYEYAAHKFLERYFLDPRASAAVLYKKTGRCRLLRVGQHDEVEVESRRLETAREWEINVPVMVTDFALKNKYVKFHLELRWEYAILDMLRIDGEPYSQTVHRALHDNMATNWQKQKFVPRFILRELFTNATIQELINNDDSVGRLAEDGRRFDKDMLVDDIITGGVHLLAPAVYAGADLSCVYQLMLASDDCTREIRESDCPAGVDKLKFERMVDCQSRFKAHVFHNDTDENGTRSVEHRHLEPHVVLPILWDDASRSVGSGGFGEVFKIKVQYDHHYFSSVRFQYLDTIHFDADIHLRILIHTSL